MNLKSEISKIIKEYRYIIITYLLLLFIYFIMFFCFESWTESKLDALFKPSFGISLSSSLLGSLIVFGILGFIAIVIPTRLSTKKLEDEPFEIRVKALMNSKNVEDNEEALEFLKNHLETYLVFNQNMHVRITVKRYDEKVGALEILSETKYSLTNMCKDKNFKPKDITMFVAPDTEVNNDFGYVSYLATSDKVEIQNYIHKLDANGFRKSLKISVPKNSQKEISFCYCVWNIVDDDVSNAKAWFFTEVERYSQNVQIEIISELDFDLTFLHGKFHKIRRERTSQETKNVLHSRGGSPFSINMELLPEERFEILFNKPVEKNEKNS